MGLAADWDLSWDSALEHAQRLLRVAWAVLWCDLLEKSDFLDGPVSREAEWELDCIL